MWLVGVGVLGLIICLLAVSRSSGGGWTSRWRSCSRVIRRLVVSKVNPMDVFHGKIGGLEYGPDETPGSIGLYGGRYNVVFYPGEFLLPA